MLKKTMTYTDYEGVQRTESFYFNLTKAEIVEMEYDIEGGMQKMLEEITEKLDGKRIMAFVKKIILKRTAKNPQTVSTSESPKKFPRLSRRLKRIPTFMSNWLPMQKHVPTSSTQSFLRWKKLTRLT
jgi:hypothetical protein